jgi:glutamate-1-semialdehyde aminotransferase
LVLHDPSNIAAIIVEPVAGSAGWYLPPKGYLKRLREICDKHGILLIFDEVISGFGRLGHAFAAERFGVTPDMICFAKAVNSGTVPMGGVRGLPGGLSFIGPAWSAARLLALGYAFEQAAPAMKLTPAMVQTVEESPEVQKLFAPSVR